ncbi:MAG: 3-deoxy-D-manno-octulosonate 8-phosphate phosphatase [Bacteroidales bacterium]|jgi:3-deoxy-D-manno-octulosonate 8-phosphate phosphatase (KDO 8-P phosphatase)|nr:3-deoxy-D-manno-octulosonate 8-phosphate phosphatase [Bacteroidales bacterium]
MKNYKEKLKDITTFVFDFDGVLSSGKVIVLPDGDQLRMTDVKDGYAIHYALKRSYRICIISGGYSESMRLRYQDFSGMDVYLKVSDKVGVFSEYITRHDIKAEEVLYMGDDIPDYEVMQLVGLRTCPADAAIEIQHISHYISHCKGGEGCVRDVIEQTLRSQNQWFQQDACIW